MSLVKNQSYYPSNFTLTLMDGFGTRKPFLKSSAKKLQPSQSQSKMPAFARKRKVTYDKQSLLEQIRMEKQKSYIINITNTQLLRNLSKKKIKIDRPTSSLLSRQPTRPHQSPLKREIEQLVAEIELQNQEIRRLKTSKKYNRFVQLQTLKQTYLEEIKQMKHKIRCFKHEIKQKRRVKREQKKRAKDIRVMNSAVQQRLNTENGIICQKLQEVCLTIKENMKKQISYQKEKDRLLKEIYELQAKTGKIYVSEQEEFIQQKQKQGKYKAKSGIEEKSNEDSQDLSEQSSSQEYSSDSSEQSQLQQPQKEQTTHNKRGRNLSF